MKLSKRLTEYERLIQDIRQEASSPSMKFKRNEELSNLLSNITALGTLIEDTGNSTSDQAKRFADLKVTEPRHDKTNKMAVRPAKRQISLGIRPV